MVDRVAFTAAVSTQGIAMFHGFLGARGCQLQAASDADPASHVGGVRGAATLQHLRAQRVQLGWKIVDLGVGKMLEAVVRRLLRSRFCFRE